MPKKKASESKSTAKIGFEAKLWLAADNLRNNMDAAEYKLVVLGLIFSKYISDGFEEHHAKLADGKGYYLEQIQEILTNTKRRLSSFRRNPIGPNCKLMPSNRSSSSTSANSAPSSIASVFNATNYNSPI